MKKININPIDKLIAHAAQGLLDFRKIFDKPGNEKHYKDHITWRIREGKCTEEDIDALSFSIGWLHKSFKQLKGKESNLIKLFEEKYFEEKKKS